MIKLRCAVWHRDTRNGKPYESISVSPERGAELKEDDELATPHTASAPAVATVGGNDEFSNATHPPALFLLSTV